jgi:hypothetical protein
MVVIACLTRAFSSAGFTSGGCVIPLCTRGIGGPLTTGSLITETEALRATGTGLREALASVGCEVEFLLTSREHRINSGDRRRRLTDFHTPCIEHFTTIFVVACTL